MCQAGRWLAINDRMTVIPEELCLRLLKVNYHQAMTFVKHSPLGKHIVVGSEQFDDMVIHRTLKNLCDRGYTMLLSEDHGRDGWVRGIPIPPLQHRNPIQKGR